MTVDDTGADLAVEGFRALLGGRAPDPADLVPSAGRRASEVARQLARRGCAELDDDGRLIGIHGLTLRSTRHRFVHDGHNHHTWCAFDSIAIPAALRLDAVVHTDCPSCGAELVVDIVGGVPTVTAAVLWLPVTSGRNLMADFCAHADVYCRMKHLEMTIDKERNAGEAVSLAAAAALGRKQWTDIAQLEL